MDTQTREKERESAQGLARGKLWWGSRVGFGREVMVQKKFVTYFPDEEKRAYAPAFEKKEE